MPNNKVHAPRYARMPPIGGSPHAMAAVSGNVVIVDGTGISPIHTPNEADIFKAITELDKKIQQLSKNQRIIESRLDHIASRLDAANANLITGVQFLTRVMNSVGWWAAGDTDTAENTYPPNPHWQ